MKNGDLKQIIQETLGLTKATSVSESYVAQPKQYEMPTENLSEKAKQAHFELYQSYVNSLNRISIELDTADRKNVSSSGCMYRSLKGDEVYNRNAVYLHELYFANASDVHSEVMVDSLSFMRMERDFGNFDQWQFDLIACSLSARDGWALTGLDFYLKRYINIFIDSHATGVPVGFYPIVCLDVHEHSYCKDYLNDKKGFIIGQMRELNWDIIEERIKRAEKILEALK